MKENMLDVLIYLFENHMFDDDGMEPDQEILEWELSLAGFDQTMISQAFNWLESLARLCEKNPPKLPMPKHDVIRHYNEYECRQLCIDSRGFLLRLEQSGVLDPVAREMVIDRLLALDVETIELEHVKWVVLLVLSNYTEEDGVSDLMETLVLDGSPACIH